MALYLPGGSVTTVAGQFSRKDGGKDGLGDTARLCGKATKHFLRLLLYASSDGYWGSLIISQSNRLLDFFKKKINIAYFALNFPVTLMATQPGQDNGKGGQEK